MKSFIEQSKDMIAQMQKMRSVNEDYKVALLGSNPNTAISPMNNVKVLAGATPEAAIAEYLKSFGWDVVSIKHQGGNLYKATSVFASGDYSIDYFRLLS